MLTRIATLVTAFDQIENDQDAMRNAAQKFQNILEVLWGVWYWVLGAGCWVLR